MLERWIYDATIQCRESVENWQQALDLCAVPLLEAGVITPEYVTAIVRQHQQLGPYYVLAPGLAMPHARPEDGAKGIGLSLLKLRDGVAFGSEEGDPVDVIIMLAAPDKHGHIDTIAALAKLFVSENDMAELHQATTVQEIKEIIQRF
ncbi:PTS system IIA component (L-Asc family) [Enterobacter sp. BIGb0383]|uniref:PTS sugar transporter subunit IIA n=1 Tax=unclassified Enterobacter TaxID=2608935 RepID=UPI000F49ED79|nr:MULTISPECIES: PTS sugar transporter subunit IIA [unclassified Enterobacter]ROP62929.1 PTS system IIA component (L-Asc family) [Enterobacter sp. BIGb0383]ROS13090.1 PTS system IIA component (L-Asc family) [Enterobacter sp. BIGb0359]